MKRLALLFGALWLSGDLAFAQPQPERPDIPEPQISAAMADAEIASSLDAWFAALHARGAFNGAALVARDGQVVFAVAQGRIGLGDAPAVSADTRFALASIGKTFTHVAVAQLMQAGRLSRDATVGDLLPDYPNAATRSATVEQLLTMRGGVADIFGPAFRQLPKTQLASNHDYYAFVSRQPPMFAPGEREEYCNGCYVVLGEIVERVSGLAYEDYIARNVFSPAGMTRSGFLRHDRLPADAARFVGRPMGPESELVEVARWHGVAGSAAGNAYSTVADMLAFDNALREHRLLNVEFTAQVLRSAPQSGRADARIGFAGGGPGVSTVLFGNGAWTVIILTNRDEPGAEAIGRAVFALLAGPRSQ